MVPRRGIVALLSVDILRHSLADAANFEPKSATWSGKTFGPDGPWNAVEVSIGAQPKIALFPGRMWATYVTTTDYCALNGSIPHCQSGGYDKDDAVAVSNGNRAMRVVYEPPGQELEAGVTVTGKGSVFLDSLDLGFQGGAILNVTVAIIESQMVEYPDGTWYPIFTGCLGVGAPNPKQIFTGGNGVPTVEGTMLPWAFKDADLVASSSFTLHYGSGVPSAKMSGSLVFGGYDRNRVLGDVLTLDGDFWKAITLQDVSIRVIKGSSPFKPFSDKNNPSIQAGLLAQGNSSISSAGLAVLLDACSPYFTLPKTTCDAIASHLPVTYNPSLGLYLWNTSSPRYAPIISSASVLSFTIMGASNTQSQTFHVPFQHLNLTLTQPFVDTPTPYFPCYTGGPGAFALGRAFFQDAFVGANWERNKIWVAQAPGPNVPANGQMVNVQPEDVTIKGGDNDWEKSWDGFWKVLTEEDVKPLEGLVDDGTGNIHPGSDDGAGDGGGGGKSGDESSSSSSSSSSNTNGGGGMSTAATAGIAVGAAVGGIALVAAAWIWWARRKRAAQTALPTALPGAEKPATGTDPPYGGYHAQKPPNWDGVPVEAPWHRALVEAPVPHRVYEMPAH